MGLHIQVDRERIAGFCQEHHIIKLAFFGSALREDFGQGSDLDVLVEFEPGQEPGFMRLAKMERVLSEMFGRQVDLLTPEDLSRLFRDEVIAGAEVQYVA